MVDEHSKRGAAQSSVVVVVVSSMPADEFRRRQTPRESLEAANSIAKSVSTIPKTKTKGGRANEMRSVSDTPVIKCVLYTDWRELATAADDASCEDIQ